jgi:tetratricopeptide (TPR) repeat protein
MTTQFVPRCLIGLALSTCMFAQGGGVKPPPGGGTGGAGGRSTNPTQPSGLPTNTQTPDFSQHPLFLSGKVTMDDGTAPPDAAMIQLVCRATPRSIGRTDSKGAFSIDLNNRATMMTFSDASESPAPSYGGAGPVGPPNNGFSNAVATAGGTSAPQGVGDRDLMGCDLQAALPGYRSDILHLSNRRSMDDPNVGTLILHRLGNVPGTTISLSSAMAPKDAKKAMEKGQNAVKKDKWEEARKEFQKAVEIYPKYAVAWVELGSVQQHLNDGDGARKSYAAALEADGKLVTPYLALASMSAREQKWQEVCDQTDRVLNLNPLDFPQAYLLNSMSNYYLKKLDVAEKSAREGLNHDAEHRFPKMNEVLAAVLIQKQDLAGAAEQFRQYLRYSPAGSDTEAARKQLARIEKVLEAKKQ